jgi:hypothetical protein
MAAIVKANARLTNGELSVVKRSFTTADDGTMTYAVEYVCLSKYARNWTPQFKTGAQPPTSLPANMLLLQLTKTPTLYDLQTETINGLTYFRATYSAGGTTEVIITESTEQRSFSATVNASVETAPATQTSADILLSFDYMSVSVTASAKNTNLPKVAGRVGAPFNKSVGKISGQTPRIVSGAKATTIEGASTTRTGRGEYTYSKTSTGIYVVDNTGFAPGIAIGL